ncbi:M23 family metallopeptidase [Ahrensia sp. R2A130]|uniref:M23 family metallopeptidase n=1 Tax=Ahrensia sp. R2A130 TaxID=744979 RepID=UPI0001E0A46E|nr:M23 family metallopeptidase [Ahrensia sp. R2A130]EFL89656.1 peptidase M23B [Ahrensia sp. R2A130]
MAFHYMRISAAFAVAFMGISLPAFAQTAGAPSLSMPLDCEMGRTCWVQNLVDIDTGPARVDPFCGAATFDTHKGTDIRVATIAEMKKGIDIKAMASGTVLGFRNDMDEALIVDGEGRAVVKGRECGNGLVIDHGNAWTTQMCHFAKGSVTVKKGERVGRGQVVGRMGLSGMTAFPHIHVTVRRGKGVVDPITGASVGRNCNPNASTSATLWDAAARTQVVAASSAVIKTGFSSAAVKGVDVIRDTVPTISTDGPLLFFANLINLKKGDRIDLVLKGPDGNVLVESKGKPMPAPKATWTTYTGRRGKPESGTYRGEVRLIRNDRVIDIKGANVTF